MGGAGFSKNTDVPPQTALLVLECMKKKARAFVIEVRGTLAHLLIFPNQMHAQLTVLAMHTCLMHVPTREQLPIWLCTHTQAPYLLLACYFIHRPVHAQAGSCAS